VGIEGVGIYFDDIIVTGATEQEHDANLALVLDRAMKNNIKFNESKRDIWGRFLRNMA